MADYCPNCGEPWTIECANCGLRWRFWKNYKFCPSCGTLAEKPGVGGKKERKVVPNIGKPKI
jgi:predicted amidophosphoribosyltransferase